MKRFSMFLVSVLVCLFASAQLTWNVKAGAGWATLRGASWENGYQGKLGWKIGVGVEKPLSANWLIMPSLEFKQKGSFYGCEEFVETVELSYLQLPVLGTYRTRLGGMVNMTLKLGPYLAYMLLGKDKYKYTDTGGQEIDIDLFYANNGGRRFDIGLLLGVDFEYRRFVFGTEFEYGFLPCISNAGDWNLYNMALYATFGYKF